MCLACLPDAPDVPALCVCLICLQHVPDQPAGYHCRQVPGPRGGPPERGGATAAGGGDGGAVASRARVLVARSLDAFAGLLCVSLHRTHTYTHTVARCTIYSHTNAHLHRHARTHTHTHSLSLSLTLSHTGNATLLRSRNDYVRAVRGLIVAAAPAPAGDDAPLARHCCARGGADALSQGWRNASLSAQLYCGEGLPSVAPVHLAVLLPGACPHACDRGVSHSVLCCVRGVSHCVTQVFSNTSACDRGVSQHCGRQPQSCLSPYCRQ